MRNPQSRKTHFGGATRAVDGIIVTYQRGTDRFSKHFAQEIHTTDRNGNSRRSIKTPKETATQQAVEYADAHDAKIVCISSPETILRDLQGTRAELEVRAGKKFRQEGIQLPEVTMLRKRIDLLVDRMNVG